MTKQGKKIIISTHDINFAKSLSEYIFMIKNGEIFEHGEPSKVLTKKNIIINHYFLSTIIIIMLNQNNLIKHGESMKAQYSLNIKKYNSFKLHYPSMISYCNTYNCFLKYRDYITHEIKNNDINFDLFDGIEEKLNFDSKTDKFQKISFNSDSSDSDTNSDTY